MPQGTLPTDYSPDETLLAGVQLKMSGRMQIHAVRGKVAIYCNYCFLCTRCAERKDPRLPEMEDKRDLSERALQIFLRTGELVRDLEEVRRRRDEALRG
jgi:hypothetical protein